MNSTLTQKRPLVKNEGLSFSISSTLNRKKKCDLCKRPFYDDSRPNARKWCSEECKKEGLRIAKKKINQRNYKDRCLNGKSATLTRCQWCEGVNRTGDPEFCSEQCRVLEGQFQAHAASGVFW